MSFLTGSFAYGVPRQTSDIDLVVLAEQWEMDLLYDILGEHLVLSADHPGNYGQDGCTSASFKLGRLNLIVFTDYAL